VAIALMLIFTITLSSCGFQPRGVSKVAPAISQLNLVTDALLPRWQNLVAERFTGAGIEQRSSAPLTLEISKIEQQRRVASYNSRAKAAQYNLILSMHYRLSDNRTQALIKDEQLSVQRIYQFDEDSVIGSRQEEGIILEELSRELMRKLLQQLQWANLTPRKGPTQL